MRFETLAIKRNRGLIPSMSALNKLKRRVRGA